jgi:hypothetical protein
MATNARSSTSGFFVSSVKRDGIVSSGQRNSIIVSLWIDERIVGTFWLNTQHQVIQVTINQSD